MSPAKKEILERLDVFLKPYGYKLVKSKSLFSKKENGFELYIDLTFNGRGGITSVNSMGGRIEITELNKVFKKLTGITNHFMALGTGVWCYAGENKWNITPIYNPNLNDLINDMNLKSLSEVPFEKKYPKELLDNCEKQLKYWINKKIFPFFKKYDTIEKVFEIYSEENPDEDGPNPLGIKKEHPEWINETRVVYGKLLAKRLKRPIPEFYKPYDKFIYKNIEERRPSNPECKASVLKKSISEFEFT